MTTDVFTAIADPTRREILRLLADEKIPVQQLAERFPVSRPAISRHLRVLREAGLVTERKDGRQRIYQLEADKLEAVRQWVTYFDRFWFDRLNDLKQMAEEEHRGTDTTDTTHHRD